MKQTSYAIVILLLLSSCTAFKQVGSSGNRNPDPSPVASTASSPELKFLDIDMKMEKTTVKNSKQALDIKKNEASKDNGAFRYASNTPSVELAKPLQFKYALLLNTEVEEVKNLKIYEYVDDWYGTRYCMGGTTKSCIDCSAFVQAFFAAIYSVAVPRTAREQYKASRKISQTEIKEGDLLFFNTRGGISHVGIYLQNNKFVHASTSGGVMISDMFESYWVKKLVGVGRINTNAVAVSH